MIERMKKSEHANKNAQNFNTVHDVNSSISNNDSNSSRSQQYTYK